MDKAVDAIFYDIIDKNSHSLDHNVAKNIRNYIEKTLVYQENLSEEIEKFKTESEQNTFGLENSIIEYEQKLDDMAKKLNGEEQKYNDLDKKYSETQKILMSKNEEIQEINLIKENVSSSYELLIFENENMKHLITEKQIMITTLQDDLKSLSQKFLQLATIKNDYMVEINQNKDSILSLELDLQQNIKYKESLLIQINSYEEEALKKDTNTMAIIREKTQQISMLTLKNDELENRNNGLHNKINQLNEKINECEARNIGLIEKNYQMENEYGMAEQELVDKLQQCEEQSSHLQRSSKESEEKFRQLKSSLEDMKKVLTETQKSYKIIDIELKQMKKLHTETTDEKDATIKELQKKLEESNTKSMVTSSDAAYKRFPQSPDPSIPEAGDTFKEVSYPELYGRYMNASKELHFVRIENQKLSSSMDSIMQEIERKAPVLIKQGYDYKNALRTISTLTNELEDSQLELQKVKRSKQALALDLKVLHQHCTRLKSYVLSLREGLSQSITSSFHQGDGDNQGHISTTTPDDTSFIYHGPKKRARGNLESPLQTSLTDSLSLLQPNALIDGILENIEDDDDKYPEDLGQDVVELSEKISSLEKEMVKFQDINNDQKKVIEALKRQKDTYHQMLVDSGFLSGAHKRSEISGTGRFISCTDSEDTRVTEQGEIDTAILDRNDIAKRMTCELDRIRKDYVDQEKDLKVKLRESETRVSEYKVTNSRLSYEIQLTKENLCDVRSKYDSCLVDVAEARRNQSLNMAQLIEKQERIDNITSELIATQQKVSTLEYRISRVQAGKDALQAENEELSKQKVSLKREETKYGMILDNLKNLQSSFEINEKESLAKVIKQNELLDRERKELKIMNETNALESRNRIKDLEKRLENSEKSNKEITKQNEEIEGTKWKLREENLDLHKRLAEKIKKSDQLRSDKFQPQQADGSPFDEDGSFTGDRDQSATNIFQSSPLHTHSLSSINKIKDGEIRELKSANKKNEEHLAHYQIMTATLEDQLKQQQDLVENLERILEEHHKAAEDARIRYEKEKRGLENRISLLEHLHDRSILDNASEVERLGAKMVDLSDQLERETRTKEELAIKLAQALAENLDTEARLERALADVQTLATRVMDLTTSMESRVNMEIDVRNSEEGFNEIKSNLESRLDEILNQNASYQTQFKELLEKYHVSQEFCQALCEQVDKMKRKVESLSEIENSEVVSLQDIAKLFDATEDATSPTDDDQKTENILKFINYLKQDNQTVRDDAETLKMKMARYRIKAETLEAELVKISDLLNHEISKNQTYDYLAKIRDLEMSLEDAAMDKRVLKTANEQLELRYNEVLRENMRSDAERRERVVRQIDALSGAKDALVAENLELRNTSTRTNAKYEEQTKRFQAVSLQIENLNAQNKTLVTFLESKEDGIRLLNEQMEDTRRKFNESRVSSESKESDLRQKITELDDETQGLKAKIEEMKITNNKLKTIARKYKQLHEEGSLSQPLTTTTAIIMGDAQETAPSSSIPSVSTSGADNVIVTAPANEPSDASPSKTDLTNEVAQYKTKCQEMQKDLEEKNLRLASLKSQYEAKFNRLHQQIEKNQPAQSFATALPSTTTEQALFGTENQDDQRMETSAKTVTSPIPSLKLTHAIGSSPLHPASHPSTSVMVMSLSPVASMPGPASTLPKANIKPFSSFSQQPTVAPPAGIIGIRAMVASASQTSLIPPSQYYHHPSAPPSYLTSGPPLALTSPSGSSSYPPGASPFGSMGSQPGPVHHKPAVCIKPLSFGQYHPGNNYNLLLTKSSSTIGIASPNVFLSPHSHPNPTVLAPSPPMDLPSPLTPTTASPIGSAPPSSPTAAAPPNFPNVPTAAKSYSSPPYPTFTPTPASDTGFTANAANTTSSSLIPPVFYDHGGIGTDVTLPKAKSLEPTHHNVTNAATSPSSLVIVNPYNVVYPAPSTFSTGLGGPSKLFYPSQGSGTNVTAPQPVAQIFSLPVAAPSTSSAPPPVPTTTAFQMSYTTTSHPTSQNEELAHFEVSAFGVTSTQTPWKGGSIGDNNRYSSSYLTDLVDEKPSGSKQPAIVAPIDNTSHTLLRRPMDIDYDIDQTKVGAPSSMANVFESHRNVPPFGKTTNVRGSSSFFVVSSDAPSFASPFQQAPQFSYSLPSSSSSSSTGSRLFASVEGIKMASTLGKSFFKEPTLKLSSNSPEDSPNDANSSVLPSSDNFYAPIPTDPPSGQFFDEYKGDVFTTASNNSTLFSTSGSTKQTVPENQAPNTVPSQRVAKRPIVFDLPPSPPSQPTSLFPGFPAPFSTQTPQPIPLPMFQSSFTTMVNPYSWQRPGQSAPPIFSSAAPAAYNVHKAQSSSAIVTHAKTTDVSPSTTQSSPPSLLLTSVPSAAALPFSTPQRIVSPYAGNDALPFPAGGVADVRDTDRDATSTLITPTNSHTITVTHVTGFEDVASGAATAVSAVPNASIGSSSGRIIPTVRLNPTNSTGFRGGSSARASVEATTRTAGARRNNYENNQLGGTGSGPRPLMRRSLLGRSAGHNRRSGKFFLSRRHRGK